MKFQLKKITAVMAMALALVVTSCSKDDPADETPTGTGTLKLEFDNVYGSADFAFGTNYTNSNGEVITPSSIKYIVSNVVLTKADGSTFTYPKSDSYFIVDEATATSQIISLPNIPAGDYKTVKFGIGVDQAQWALGATGQGNFLTAAQTAGMMWSWTAGYKFLAFEGTFTSATVTTAAQYKIHTGQTGTDYNYSDVTLALPANALVRTTITPQIHILTDLKKIMDGTHKVSLSTAATIMGGSQLAQITTNFPSMFSVAHVHND